MTSISKKFLTVLIVICSGIMLMSGLATIPIHAQAVESCDLVNKQERMLIFFSPMYAGSQIKDILAQGEPYTMIQDSGGEGFYHIEYRDGQRGWIEFHTRNLNGRCGMETPLQPLSEFSTICYYNTTEELTGYTDTTFEKKHPIYHTYPPGRYEVASIWENAIRLYGNPISGGGLVEANRGTFSGLCEGTLQLATALDNARIWTEPSATTGQVIKTLDIGAEVGVTGDLVSGEIQENITGNWYPVIQGDVAGWVWEDRLVFGRTFTAPKPVIEREPITETAYLWSEPDAKSGSIITEFPAGTTISIIGDPQEGFIQRDSDQTGIWYPVQIGGNVGWIYEGHIDFS